MCKYTFAMWVLKMDRAKVSLDFPYVASAEANTSAEHGLPDFPWHISKHGEAVTEI